MKLAVPATVTVLHCQYVIVIKTSRATDVIGISARTVQAQIRL
jgi:hypothetical protein